MIVVFNRVWKLDLETRFDHLILRKRLKLKSLK